VYRNQFVANINPSASLGAATTADPPHLTAGEGEGAREEESKENTK
jgi:hypothetical protein